MPWRWIGPDNLKTGVISTVLNRSYKELAEYYNTAIVPCRVEAPKDKGHAEATVNYAETTKEVVKCFLTAGKEAEQGFKSCASLTKLADKYGNER